MPAHLRGNACAAVIPIGGERMPRDSREEFVLVLQTAADGSQAVRLRMMLKMALRRFGLRCVQLQPGLQQSGKFADATASNTGDPSSISR